MIREIEISPNWGIPPEGGTITRSCMLLVVAGYTPSKPMWIKDADTGELLWEAPAGPVTEELCLNFPGHTRLTFEDGDGPQCSRGGAPCT